MVKISLIVPCYNEEKNLQKMYDALKVNAQKLATSKGYNYEFIFVNDGSKDQSEMILNELAAEDEHFKFISFSRNFGKESAMFAGIQYASGDVCAILDADLQHPPELLGQMMDRYEEGYDQVIAKRTRTGEAKVRTWLSKRYYKFVNKIMDVEVEDGIGDFRVLSRKVMDAIADLPENNRFSKGLFSWVGFKTTTIEYENQLRDEGESKWGLKNLWNYAIDGIVSFNIRPLRAVIYTGVVVTFVSLLYIIYIFANILLTGVETPGYFSMISAVLLLGGIQLISIGIVGEYVGRIFFEVKKRPVYLVGETNIVSKPSMNKQDHDLIKMRGTHE
ncbi:glycosyltransferase family 2 protein [Kurthia senegalensis]|uniref:glycosyltransferase family 2 protein n=1 Tax=Kurthia senegalensis TaxID=1033740 RepID=UPI000288663B|nr:glycosyltransferase family 2 protein [Kurthia senegalensis]